MAQFEWSSPLAALRGAGRVQGGIAGTLRGAGLANKRQPSLVPTTRAPAEIVELRQSMRMSQPRGGFTPDAGRTDENDSVTRQRCLRIRPELSQGYVAGASNVPAVPLAQFSNVDHVHVALQHQFLRLLWRHRVDHDVYYSGRLSTRKPVARKQCATRLAAFGLAGRRTGPSLRRRFRRKWGRGGRGCGEMATFIPTGGSGAVGEPGRGAQGAAVTV